MYAITTSSRQFDDTEAILQDLLKGVTIHNPEHTLALLVCDSQVDCRPLVLALTAKLGIAVLGGTTLTMPLCETPDEVSATLTVFSRPGLEYSVAVSPPLDESDPAGQMADLYRQCIATLSSEPKLLIPFIPLVPGLGTDKFVSQLFELAGNIPVFGGTTTNDLHGTQALVFAAGDTWAENMVLVALSGDIQPVFAMGSQLTVMAEYAPAVTQSKGNVVHQVDGISFCQYMQNLGIAPENRVNGVDALVQYGPMPVRLRGKSEDDGIPEIRCISYTSPAEGSAAFSSELPEGTRVNIGLIHKNDVLESAEACYSTLLARMAEKEQQGYQFQMLFSLPCVARYYAMVGDDNLESKLLNKTLSDKLAVTSYYGFLEIGPTFGENGQLHNRTNNASIIMCAL